MASVHFSWSDSLQAAFSSCLFCFKSSESDQDDLDNSRPRNALINTAPPPRARPDELEGLLADSDSADAETMSLHSNIGDERRRRKRRRPRRGIRLFGYDLFGRSPIQLPESDDEDPHSRGVRRSRTISSSTSLDSDAAPIDPSTLDETYVARLAAATAAAEEEQRRAKEERRRLRKERKELKKMTLAMAMGMHATANQEQFEGIPGSGPNAVSELGSGSGSATSSPFVDDFGPFMQSQTVAALDDDDADADGADFGAESYARRPTQGGSSGGIGSDSRSRTSGSGSRSRAGSVQYSQHHLSQGQQSSADPAQKQRKRRLTRSKSLSSKQSESTSDPTSQSISLPSPPADRAAFAQPDVAGLSVHHEENEFEGFQGGTLDLALEHANVKQDAKATNAGVQDFPSVGLRGVQRTKSDMGVFLARRGDE
ncbi:hypothetical protein IEO21_03016 [Rhodonia placenta]|uniref:Uncharacterized protein n=1 Tax=Rhodonia placenta TaxID=104341 RepID=A0A8H7P6N5_9APHY|nr:hypothetical protein IEO21_03016 [Postia placenta]